MAETEEKKEGKSIEETFGELDLLGELNDLQTRIYYIKYRKLPITFSNGKIH